MRGISVISELLGGEIPQFLDSPKMLRYVINYALNIEPHPPNLLVSPNIAILE